VSASQPRLDLIIEGVRPYGAGEPLAVAIDRGVIRSIGPDARELTAGQRIDGSGGLIFPSFVEPHIHLDKALTRKFPGANAQDWEEADAFQGRVKRTFTPEDVEARASRAIELAISNGVGLMGAHVAIDTAQQLISLEGVLRARRAGEARRAWRRTPAHLSGAAVGAGRVRPLEARPEGSSRHHAPLWCGA
jgi:cytosine/creatinine deaminase